MALCTTSPPQRCTSVRKTTSRSSKSRSHRSGSVNRQKELRVELVQVLIDGFLRSSGQQDRQPDFASLKLAFMKQPRAGQSRGDDGRRPLLCRRKRGALTCPGVGLDWCTCCAERICF